MLRQAQNKVEIEGILSEIDLKYGSYVKESKTVETIGGSIKVRVNQNINGEDKTCEIPVHMFSNKYTNNGGPNPAYNSIEKVMKEYVSIASCGSEAGADKIRITNGSVRMNVYPNAQGNIVSFPRIQTSFVSKVTGEFRPKAEWTLEFAVSSMDYLTDKDGVELDPKRLRVKVLVPQYGGKVETMELIADTPEIIEPVSDLWENGKTYLATGVLNFTQTTRTAIEQIGFGKAKERTFTQSVSELIITGGSEVAYDEEMAFSPVELAEALKQYKAYVESLKEKTNNKTRHAPAPASTNGPVDLGF